MHKTWGICKSLFQEVEPLVEDIKHVALTGH